MEENIKKCIHNHNKVYSLTDNLNTSKVINKEKNKISCSYHTPLYNSLDHNNALTYSESLRNSQSLLQSIYQRNNTLSNQNVFDLLSRSPSLLIENQRYFKKMIFYKKIKEKFYDYNVLNMSNLRRQYEKKQKQAHNINLWKYHQNYYHNDSNVAYNNITDNNDSSHYNNNKNYIKQNINHINTINQTSLSKSGHNNTYKLFTCPLSDSVAISYQLKRYSQKSKQKLQKLKDKFEKQSNQHLKRQKQNYQYTKINNKLSLLKLQRNHKYQRLKTNVFINSALDQLLKQKLMLLKQEVPI